MGIVGILLILLVGLLLAVVILGVYVLRRRRPAGAEPVCGRCGYNVRGLPTFTCPECGSDLREVGIRTAGQPRALGPWARVALWTLILPVPATIVSFGLLITVIPTVHDRSDTLDLDTAGSPSGLSLQLQAQGRALGGPPRRGLSAPVPLQRLTLTLAGAQASAAPLEVDLRTLGYKCRQPNGDLLEQSIGLDASALRAWLTGAGVDVNDDRVQTQIAELLKIVQGTAGGTLAVVPGGSWSQVGGGSSTRGGSAGEIPLLGFWIVIWLLGLWLCIRRRRLAGPAAP